MASVNKVIVIGNLGRDPEVRYTPSGSAVCNLAVATTRSWKSKEDGQRQEETEWHRVTLYERLAEIAGEYLKKGRPVYIEGRLKTRKWQDKEGRDCYTTEIIADQMQMLGGRDDGGGEHEAGARQRNTGGDGRQRTPAPAPAPRRQERSTGAAPRSSTGFDDMDDDIPFINQIDAEPGERKQRRVMRTSF